LEYLEKNYEIIKKENIDYKNAIKKNEEEILILKRK